MSASKFEWISILSIHPECTNESFGLIINIFLSCNHDRNIPYVGTLIHGPLRDYLQQQKKSLHRGTNQPTDAKVSFYLYLLLEI